MTSDAKRVSELVKVQLGSRWGSGRIRQNQAVQKVQKTKKSS